jgi:hypothetical protein
MKNFWDITTVGFCMRFLDSEGKESFNVLVPLQLFPPYEQVDYGEDNFLVTNLCDRLLLAGDRSFTSIKVTPLES